jgi:hypothetical protein
MLRRLRAAITRWGHRIYADVVNDPSRPDKDEVGAELGWDTWVLGDAAGLAGAGGGWLMKRLRRKKRAEPDEGES